MMMILMMIFFLMMILMMIFFYDDFFPWVSTTSVIIAIYQHNFRIKSIHSKTRTHQQFRTNHPYLRSQLNAQSAIR